MSGWAAGARTGRGGCRCSSLGGFEEFAFLPSRQVPPSNSNPSWNKTSEVVTLGGPGMLGERESSTARWIEQGVGWVTWVWLGTVVLCSVGEQGGLPAAGLAAKESVTVPLLRLE